MMVEGPRRVSKTYPMATTKASAHYMMLLFSYALWARLKFYYLHMRLSIPIKD
jgi:hypothetical protein